MSVITTAEECVSALESLKGLDKLVVDVETNGLQAFGWNQLCGVGIATSPNDSLYFPFRHQSGENLPIAFAHDLMALLSECKTLIGYNLKFDLHFLANDGLEVKDQQLVDVIVMVRMSEHSDTKDLGLTDTLIRTYGSEYGQYDVDTKKLLRKNKWNKDFSLAPPDILGPYCEQDVLMTYKLYEDRFEKLKETKQLDLLNMQCELTKVLYKMEKRGISVDQTYATQTNEQLAVRLEDITKDIHQIAGTEFNISSSQQIGEAFATLGISSPVKTAKGADSWSESALIQIDHPMAGLIRQYRTLLKLQSTYIEPYLDIPDNTIHTSFCNWGAATGRLSSREPNLQNIPRNHFKLKYNELTDSDLADVKNRIAATMAAKGQSTESTNLSNEVLQTWGFMGDESFDEDSGKQIAIRRLFVPRPNYTLVGFDYSQMEVRVFMSYFRNEVIDALLNKDDVDFHGEAGKLAFNTTEDDADYKFYRQMAKAITFGTIYGIGRNKLALQLGTTPHEAGQYKKRYFDGLEGSKEFFDKVVETVESRGWIRNRYGRVYKINPKFAYKGVNYLVQGTSADIMSERMIEVDKYLETTKSNILLQVHDEIICEIHDDDLRNIPFKIKELLEINSLDIPLQVDMEVCTPSWATKKDYIKPDDSVENYIDW